MITILLDGAEITGMEVLHSRFAAALDFPETYGKNLDALYDLLTEFAGEGITITLRNPEKLRENLGRRVFPLEALLRDAASENSRISLFLDDEGQGD